ncbi:MAG: methyltransferase domain-containing protein [bacterium]
MKDKLLKLLCCPKCKEDLAIHKSEIVSDKIRNGDLQCPVCQIKYPIKNFIPRFVKTDKYVKSFSFEWQIHHKTQLDSTRSVSESEDTFIEKTGLKLEKLKGKLILDVGCGVGRYIEPVARCAQEVVGIDLSYAVDSAQENLKYFDNVHIIQADIFNLPFKKETFDFIYSIGVLHHTPDTKKAFLNLIPFLKKGGSIAIWLYSNETRYERVSNKFTDFYRFFTRRLPKRLLWYLCHLAIPLYTLKNIKKLRTVLDLVLPMSNHPDPEWRVLDTFDWYSPMFQHKHTYREVVAWFEEAGLRDIELLNFPVSVKGRK